MRYRLMDLEAETEELKRELAAAKALLDEKVERDATLRDSEVRHRLLIESWTQAVWETDGAGVVVTDSPSWRAYTGQTLDEWLGYGWLDAVHPDDRAYAERQWREAMAARRVVDAEFRLRAPYGGWRSTNVRAAPVLDTKGNIEKWSGVNIDIEARKRAEAALRDSEERFRALFASSPAPFVVISPDAPRFTILDVNDAYLSAMLRMRDQVVGRGLFDAFPDNPGDPAIAGEEELRASVERVLATRQRDELPAFRYDIERPDGSYEERWWRPVTSPLLDAHGIVTAIIHNPNDVTVEHRMDAALRESEERQAFLLKFSDALRTELNVDAMAHRALELLSEQLQLDRCYITYYRPEDDEADFPYQVGNATVPPLPPKVRLSDFPDAYEQVLEKTFVIEDDFERRGLSEGERINSEALGMRAMLASTVRRGEKNPLSSLAAVSSRPRKWTAGEIALIEEVAERTWSAMQHARAEAALRASEEKYRTLFEKMDEGYGVNEVVRDAEGRAVDMRYLELNPALERLTGVPASQARGRLASEVFPGLDRFWVDFVDRVVTTGTPEQVEHELTPTGRWYQSKSYPIGGDRCASLYEDITQRKRAEALLRQSEERQSFLLALGDATRSQASANEKIPVAARLLGERLNASRILYADYDWTRGVAHIFNGWFADGAQPFPTEMRLQDYDGEVLNDLKAGRTVRVDDVKVLADQPGFTAIAEVGVQALLSAPLMINGQLAMNLSVHQHDPRHWTDDEVALVQEVAERLWAEVVRARAESGLRQSEERFRQFAQASAAGMWIRNAKTLTMEYISPAIARIYGVEPDAFLGDIKHWAAMIVPEDREGALSHIEAARQGAVAVHEFRIQRPDDGNFRWIRNTDFPLLDAQGNVERIGGLAEDVTASKLAVEHQGVLLAELQHRVRNIMAMIRSMTLRSADGAANVGDYQSLLEGRLLALARVQVLLTRGANTGGWLRSVLEAEIESQAHHNRQFELIGPDVGLSPKAVEVLTLAFHELTTNALKYGALSVPEGRLRVEWSAFEERGRAWLALDWTEEGAPWRGPVTLRGFGSDLIEGRIPYELGGTGKITIQPDGAHCHLEFPLKEGESILETDAPTPATVFGGTLDMSEAPDLSGRDVLVVEDDYYIAGDTAAAREAPARKCLVHVRVKTPRSICWTAKPPRTPCST